MKPIEKQCDILVVGAGLTGLIAMLRFAEAGFSVIGIEKSAPPESGSRDSRSTAFLMPGVDTLHAAGIWASVEQIAVPLKTMEIVNASVTPPSRTMFHADEIGETQFAFNIQNAPLNDALRAAVNAHSAITLYYQTELTQLYQQSEYVTAQLSNGQILRADVVVAADGRNSGVRRLLDIGAQSSPTGQMATVFTVTHTRPHQEVSTEIHESGGPFTFVPVPDIDGQPASTIVWMDVQDKSVERDALSDAAFIEAAQMRARNWYGDMVLQSRRVLFPIIFQEADRLLSHRVAIIGEAAHVVPPIGAQGLNISLKDIESLTRSLLLGGLRNPAQLASWERMRRADIKIRAGGISLLNHFSKANASSSLTLRENGLQSIMKLAPVKKGLMRLGMGKRLHKDSR